jgi:hypothetical protein
VLNLNGFTIVAGEEAEGTGIVVQSSNVTIENGSLSNLYLGIIVGNPVFDKNTPFITGFVIHNVELVAFDQALGLNNINGGNVYDCQFLSVGFNGNDGSAISENGCANFQYSDISIGPGFVGIISITGGPRFVSSGAYINRISSPGSAEPSR